MCTNLAILGAPHCTIPMFLGFSGLPFMASSQSIATSLPRSGASILQVCQAGQWIHRGSAMSTPGMGKVTCWPARRSQPISTLQNMPWKSMKYAMNIPNWPSYFWNFRNMPCFTQPDSTPSPPHVFLNQISYLGAALKGQFTSAELPHEPLHLCLSRVKCSEAWGNKEVTLNGMEGINSSHEFPWSIVFCRGTTAEQIMMSLSPIFFHPDCFRFIFQQPIYMSFSKSFLKLGKKSKKKKKNIWASHCPPIPFRHLMPSLACSRWSLNLMARRQALKVKMCLVGWAENMDAIPH